MAAVWEPDPAGVYFSDDFDVDPALLEEYDALDMSVVTDLPLFTDPFLLFNSENPIYQASHEQIIGYLRFLRSKANVPLDRNLVAAWYQFGEVKQNWLGFTEDGNSGHGLGAGFAAVLHGALTTLLDNLGAETVTDQAVADGERAQHSHSTAEATSSGLPMRPTGSWPMTRSRPSGLPPENRFIIGSR